MQAQLDRLRAETTAIRDSKEKVERMLEGLGSLKIDQEEVPTTATTAGAITKAPAAGRGMDELEGEMWGMLVDPAN